MMEEITTDLRFSMIPHWILDSGLSHAAIRLYAILAKFADSQTGQAFPGRTRLSKELGCGLKTVDRCVAELVEFGAVRKTQRVSDGHYQSSLYTVMRVKPGEPILAPRVTSDATPRHGRPDPVSPVTHRTITTKPEPLKNTNDSFEEFWKLYPRKVGKGKARAAFEKALVKTDVKTILDGVVKYGKNDGAKDVEFVAHPTSWLNGERWDDVYEQDQKPTPGPGRREWVRNMHELGEHWACEPGEFEEGCD